MAACWLFFWSRLLHFSLEHLKDDVILVGRCTLASPSCFASKAAMLIGPIYWFGPVDLIPDRIPVWGYSDQLGFILLSVVLARLLIPKQRVFSHRAVRPSPASDRPRTLVFCHCPKTAGTSLFRALSDRLGYHRSYLMRRTRPDLAHLQRRGFTFVSGHAAYGHYDAAGAVNARTTFITFYREPRAVLLSRFSHFLRHRHDSLAAQTFFGQDLPAGGIAPTSPAALNLFLARHRSFDASDADNPQTRFAANHFLGPLDLGHLVRAKETLAAMSMVGCTERFEDSLRLLAYQLGWSRLTYHRLNVSDAGERIPLSPALEAELDRHLDFDRELVRWAEERFTRDYAAMEAEHAVSGRPLPDIRLVESDPPFRRPFNRIAAASTLLFDDWCWWFGTRLHGGTRLRRRITPPAGGDDPDLRSAGAG